MPDVIITVRYAGSVASLTFDTENGDAVAAAHQLVDDFATRVNPKPAKAPPVAAPAKKAPAKKARKIGLGA